MNAIIDFFNSDFQFSKKKICWSLLESNVK
jgi:hypothetical protein